MELHRRIMSKPQLIAGDVGFRVQAAVAFDDHGLEFPIDFAMQR